MSTYKSWGTLLKGYVSLATGSLSQAITITPATNEFIYLHSVTATTGDTTPVLITVSDSGGTLFKFYVSANGPVVMPHGLAIRTKNLGTAITVSAAAVSTTVEIVVTYTVNQV